MMHAADPLDRIVCQQRLYTLCAYSHTLCRGTRAACAHPLCVSYEPPFNRLSTYLCAQCTLKNHAHIHARACTQEYRTRAFRATRFRAQASGAVLTENKVSFVSAPRTVQILQGPKNPIFTLRNGARASPPCKSSSSSSSSSVPVSDADGARLVRSHPGRVLAILVHLAALPLVECVRFVSW